MDPAIAAQHLLAGKYFQIAAFTMAVYDHMLMFGQEVERIWTRRFSYVTMLYLITHYGTLMQCIILVEAFNDPTWTEEVCKRFVMFEGASGVALMGVGQMIMILRVFAIYSQSKSIFAFLLLLWAFQIIISAVGLSTAYPVPLAPGLVGCILTGHSTISPSMWISPLVTDSCIFFLTVYRARQYIYCIFTPSSSKPTAKTITILLRDGTIYFFLIFLANLMNVLIYFLAEPDLKTIGATFSQLLTSTVVSRLVLNLRSLSDDSGNTTVATENTIVFNPGNDLETHSRNLWSKALDKFTRDGTCGNFIPSGDGRRIVEDVPLQRIGAV